MESSKSSHEMTQSRTVTFTFLLLLAFGSFGIGIKLLTQGIDLHHYGYSRDSFLDCIWGISSLLLFTPAFLIPAYALSCYAQRISFVLTMVWQSLAASAVIIIFIMAIVVQFAGKSDFSCASAPDGRNYSSNAYCIGKCETQTVPVCCCCTDSFSGEATGFIYDTKDVHCHDFNAAVRIENDVKELCWYANLILFITINVGTVLTYCSLCRCCKIGLWDFSSIRGSPQRLRARTEVTVTRFPIAQVVRQDDRTNNVTTVVDSRSEHFTNVSGEPQAIIAEVAS